MKSVLVPVYSSLDVAKLTGVSLRQLQWWDEQGIVTPMQKGRRRLYSPAEVLLVSLIVGLRRKRLSLQKIRKVLGELKGANGMAHLAVNPGVPDVYLLTDGDRVSLENSPQAIVDVLKEAAMPMISLCISDLIRQLDLPEVETPRKPVHGEITSTGRIRRARTARAS